MKLTSLARLRFAPPLPFGRDRKALSLPKLGVQLISRAVREISLPVALWISFPWYVQIFQASCMLTALLAASGVARWFLLRRNNWLGTTRPDTHRLGKCLLFFIQMVTLLVMT